MVRKTSRLKDRYPPILLCAFLLLFLALAISPADRTVWAIEHVLTALALLFLVLTYRTFRLSGFSYTLIALFLALHAVGAHSTYAQAPLGHWLEQWWGLARNPYDRVVHFSFGLLLAYPIRELFLRVASTKGFWGYWLPVELTLALSGIYEFIEWGTAAVAGTQATDFLATQGDTFDPLKDMALATIGSAAAMLALAWANWRRSPSVFEKEMRKSLKVDRKRPLEEL